jgi:hypothetical protein
MQSKEFSGNQGKHKNFDPSFLPYKFRLILIGIKQKRIQNGRLKKTEFFKIADSQKIFSKISQIVPWVSKID